jgi:hypothetical protein
MSKQPSVTVTTEPSRTVSSEDRRAVAAVDQPSRSTAQASLLRTLQKLLPWGAVFVGGLLVGWLVVGGLLAPLPGIKAEPWHLSSPHKSIYFQLAADSYHATNKAALIEEALAGWDPQDLASALAQAEAAAVDRASRLRVAALRNLLNIPAGPVTLLDFVRQQGPIYITLSLSALVFILAGGVIVVPQIQGAVTIDDEKAVTSQDAGRREEGSVFVMDDGETLDDLINSFSERDGEASAAVDADGAVQAGTQRPHGTETSGETPSDGRQSAGDADAGSSNAEAGEQQSVDGDPHRVSAQDRAKQDPSTDSETTGASSAGSNGSSSGVGALTSQPDRDADSAQPNRQNAMDAIQVGSGAIEGGDLAALSEGDVSGAAGDGISDLLLTEVFGKLFDVEDIFDPELRAISESVDQVDIASLRRRCDLVNMQLQARYYLPEMEREDVNG